MLGFPISLDEESHKDPYDFCSDLRGRFYVLASGAMKEITPFEAEDI